MTKTIPNAKVMIRIRARLPCKSYSVYSDYPQDYLGVRRARNRKRTNPAELRPFAATECYPTPFSLEFTAYPFIIWQRQEKSKLSPEGPTPISEPLTACAALAICG